MEHAYNDLGDDDGDVGAAEHGVDGAGDREDGADIDEELREVELERVVAGEHAGGGGGGVVGREAEWGPTVGGWRKKRHRLPGIGDEESARVEEAGNGEPGKNGEFSMATACKMAWQRTLYHWDDG